MKVQSKEATASPFPWVATEALSLRRSGERGHADHGWLDARHSFSFARYYDPKHMGFRALRVLNEDRIAPGGGFPMHPHKDMEIITYILEGALEHKDSLHNGSVIRPGEIQKMTAGSGIRHSEFNPSRKARVHLMQIWLLPDRRNHKPGYDQKVIKPQTIVEPIRLIASPDGTQGAVKINQDAYVYACLALQSQSIHHLVRPGRHIWLQCARGSAAVNGVYVQAGDGLSTSSQGLLDIQATQNSEFLLFDLA